MSAGICSAYWYLQCSAVQCILVSLWLTQSLSNQMLTHSLSDKVTYWAVLGVFDTLPDSIQCVNFAKKWFIQYLIQYCFTQDPTQNIISSVRSSNSHPDLLLTHHHHPTHFFRSHRSSTLDFHFLSHYSYIKAIKLSLLLGAIVLIGMKYEL